MVCSGDSQEVSEYTQFDMDYAVCPLAYPFATFLPHRSEGLLDSGTDPELPPCSPVTNA